MNNEWLRKGFGLIGIVLFIGAFFWVGDVHSYLDQHYWHFDHVERGEVLKASLIGWPLSWVAAFFASFIPFLLTGIVAAHFHDEEVKQKEQAELEDEEQRLSQEFNILFQMKMQFEKQGESSDFEKAKLLGISERLDEIRAW